MNFLKTSLLSSYVFLVALALLIGLTIWWAVLGPFNPTPETEQARYLWGGIYQVMAYWGGINGLLIAHKWGGTRSAMGKSITAFAFGLLAQGFGQTVYTFYLFYLNIEAPYPSLGDLGYFGTIPLYIVGVLFLARVIGVRLSVHSYQKKISALLIPLIMLFVSYVLFLRYYEFDFGAPLKTLLDFGYPLGQAIYVSLAILALLFSRKMLGGIMKFPVLFLLIALIFQYLSDYVFLYEFNKEAWYVGGLNDYMYLFSYFLMTAAIAHIGVSFRKILES
jgi:hypothetical protein